MTFPKTLFNKKRIQHLIGFTLSVILLYAAFTKIDVSVLINSAKETQLKYVILGIFSYIVSFLIRAFLWNTILNLKETVGIYPLFRSVVIGRMGNNLIPFRGGELLRAYSIKKSSGVSISMALTSILVERVFDLVSLIIMIGVLSLYMEIPEFLVLTIGGIIIFTLVSLFVMTYLANLKSNEKYFNWFMKFIPENQKSRFPDIFHNLMQGFGSLKSLESVLSVIVLSLSCWIFAYLAIYFALNAYNIETNWWKALFVFIVVNLGMTLPMLPASLGVYQFFSVLTLGYFGVDKSIALGFSFTIQAIDIIPSVGLGLLFFSRDHLSLSSLWKGPDSESARE